MKKPGINGVGGKLLQREQGQALPEYAAMLGLLLALLFIAKAVGFQARVMFEWVVTNLH